MEREQDIASQTESTEVVRHPDWDSLLEICRELMPDLPKEETDYIAGGTPTEGRTHERDVDDEIEVQVDSFEEALDYATTLAIERGVEDEFFTMLAERGISAE